MPIGIERMGFFASSPDRTEKKKVFFFIAKLHTILRLQLKVHFCDISPGSHRKQKTLTCCGDAIKAHKGIETGGSARQDSCEAKRSKTAHTKVLLHTKHQKENRLAPQFPFKLWNLSSTSNTHFKGLWVLFVAFMNVM